MTAIITMRLYCIVDNEGSTTGKERWSLKDTDPVLYNSYLLSAWEAEWKWGIREVRESRKHRATNLHALLWKAETVVLRTLNCEIVTSPWSDVETRFQKGSWKDSWRTFLLCQVILVIINKESPPISSLQESDCKIQVCLVLKPSSASS